MGMHFCPDFYGVYVDGLQWRDDVTLRESGLIVDGEYCESDADMPLSAVNLNDDFYDMDAILDEVVDGTGLTWVSDDAGYGIGCLPCYSWEKQPDGSPSTLAEAEQLIKSVLGKYFKSPIKPCFNGSEYY